MAFDMPKATRALLIANVAAYLAQQLIGSGLVLTFALWPWGPDVVDSAPDGSTISVGFRVWQLVTYSFLHGSPMHLLLNMLSLFMLGGAIERALGARHFVIYYFACVVTAAIAQLVVVATYTGGFYPTVGASGGVFGILLAFAVLYPREKLMVIPIPVPIPAWLFATLYAVSELWFGVTKTQAGIAHFAHLGGMVGGFVLLQYWRGRLPIKPARLLR
jgi:membrane associated rhomboid family serine protease